MVKVTWHSRANWINYWKNWKVELFTLSGSYVVKGGRSVGCLSQAWVKCQVTLVTLVTECQALSRIPCVTYNDEWSPLTPLWDHKVLCSLVLKLYIQLFMVHKIGNVTFLEVVSECHIIMSPLECYCDHSNILTWPHLTRPAYRERGPEDLFI